MKKLTALLVLCLSASCADIDEALARRLDAGASGGGEGGGGGIMTGGGGGVMTGGGGGVMTGGGGGTTGGGGGSAADAGICFNGFCWENPTPQGNPINAVWGRTSDDLWMFGDVGTAMHWTPAGWETHQANFPQSETLRSAWGAGGQFWVVGTRESGAGMNPKRFSFDGGGWTTESWLSGPAPDLLSIRGRDENEVWAAGYSGVIAQRGPAAWNARTSALGTVNFRALAFDQAGACMVAFDNPGAGIARCDAGVAEFDLISGQDQVSENAMWSSGPGVFRAAGTHNIGPTIGKVWAKTDGGWGDEFSGGLSCSAAASQGAYALVFCGRGTVFEPPDYANNHGPGIDISDVMVGAWTPGVLAGSWLAGLHGRVYRHNGVEWIPQQQGSLETVFALWVDDERVLGAGSSNSAFSRQLDTSWLWEELPLGRGETRDLWLSPTDDYRAYVGVDRMLLEGPPAMLLQAPDVPLGNASVQLNGLWGTSSNDLWAVGTPGELWHREDGGWSRTSLFSGTGPDLWDIDGTADGGAFIVGSNCTVLRRDPTADGGWVAAGPSACTGSTLYGVWAPGPNDAGLEAVAVGPANAAYFRKNGTWTIKNPGAPGELFKVWGTSPSDIWAVGILGGLVHYDGSSWVKIETGTRWGIEAIRGRDAGAGKIELFLAGENGTVLRRIVP